MKKNSVLSRLSPLREFLHEIDKKLFPERHFLTQDVYDTEEALEMCYLCAEFLEWDKHMQYDARTNRFYKKDKRA